MRSYIKCFTRETLEVDEANDKGQLTTFKAGLRSRDLVASLAKNPPRTMAEMLIKAQKYMNAEDAIAAIRDIEKSGDKGRKEDEGIGDISIWVWRKVFGTPLNRKISSFNV